MEIEGKFKPKPVLKLEIWHDYFLDKSDKSSRLPINYGISDTISLIPTQECEKALRNLHWLFRPQPYGAVLLALTDTRAEGLTPIVPIDTDVRLTFWMIVKDTNFSNYTNLPLISPRNCIHYFSNLSHNSPSIVNASANESSTTEATNLFLTKPLKKYSKKEQYSLGDIVTYDQGSKSLTLEAATYLSKTNLTDDVIASLVKDADASNGAPSSSERNWLPLPNSQYVSQQDRYPCQALARTETLVRANPGDTVRLVNLNGQETLLFQVPEQHPPETDLTVPLSFVEELPGHYQLWLNKEKLGEDFVLFDPIAGQQSFALVELSLDPLVVSSPFQLLEQGGKTQQLHPKTYRIRFRNRATRWRYHIDHTPKSRGSKDRKSADTLRNYFKQLPDYFEHNIDQEQNKRTFTFTTKSPFGHYRSPPERLADGDGQPLPVPDPAIIPNIEFESDNSRNIKAIFSDIYL